MTLFEIVALYVALNLIILIALTYRVAQLRMKHQVSLNDGGHLDLIARIRSHANFIETAPMALIGLISLASLSAPPLLLHALGAAFTIGRIAHAHGMMQKHNLGRGRPIGMILTLITFLVIIISLFTLSLTS